ncbi:endopeptidase [Sarcoptes scabiei]|uniref:Endopeptidase n=1 Tax=Sarcoptes scabiei TaxID=52283 RepID=A0A132A9Y6_SARSC|nr:endopeptidase [Sarcoptes scabiei]
MDDVSNHGRDNVVLPVNNNNSSLAFGSTQSRNIDLTRPLVMPGSTARPRSEIFPDNFNINQSIGSNSNQHQSHSDSTSVVYAKDDNIYRPNSSRPNDLFNQPISHNIRSTNSRNDVQQCWPEPVIVSKHQSQNHMFPGASSFLRAARRHDPELVPAKSKYLFRDYGAPSSGWSFSVTSSSVPGSNFKKESSLMTSSMTSTKSFQTKHFSALSGNSSSSNRPKKSFSMNRLDQLAQPRKRVKSNVPSSTSFVKGKIDDKSNEMTTSKSAQFDRNTVSSTSTSKITAAKTAPPNRGKVSKESPIGTFNRISSISTTPNSGKKPRPKSQVEPLNSSSPVFESPLSDEKQTEEDDGKLAEYKKQLAEKKAQYRKMQEQKLKQLSKSEKSSNDETKDEEKEKKNEKPVEISIKKQSEPRPVVPLRRPRSIIGASSSENGNQIKSLADETKEALEKKPLEQILGSESDSNLNNNASLSSNGTRMEDNQIDNFKKSQSSNSDADNIEMNITVDDIQNQSETVTVAVEIPIDQLNLEINQLSIDGKSN